MKKYVCLNTITGEFSDSWSEQEHEFVNPGIFEENGTYKLIEYTCLNDNDFQFYNLMKIVANN